MGRNIMILLFCCILIQSCTEDNATGLDDDVTSITIPSDGIPTIQAGIDSIADGGIIYIEPGTYDEIITIRNKTVHIKGIASSDSVYPKIVCRSTESSVITFASDGGGSLEGLSIQGGHAGIRGIAENRIAPVAVEIEEIAILDAEMGIGGTFSDLTIKNTEIDSTEWGVVLYELEELEMLHTFISNVEYTGLIVLNYHGLGQNPIEIVESSFAFCAEGGIAVVGDANDVSIRDCGVGLSGMFGILLIENGSVEILSTNITHIAQVYTDPTIGWVGDGISINSSDFVDIRNCWFYECDRVGILFGGSGGNLQDSRFEYLDIGLALIEGSQVNWENQNNVFEEVQTNCYDEEVGETLPVPTEPPDMPDPP